MTRDLTGSSMCSCGTHCQAPIGACPVLVRTYHRVDRVDPVCHPARAPHVLPFSLRPRRPLSCPVTHLARPRDETRKTREAAHFSTIPACGARTLERHGSPVY